MGDNQKKVKPCFHAWLGESGAVKLGRPTCVLIALLLSVAAILSVWVALRKFEGEGPLFQLHKPVAAVGRSYLLAGSVSDQKSGLRTIWIGILQEGKETAILDRRFPSNGLLAEGLVKSRPFSSTIDVAALGLSDGPALLRAVAQDYSWRGWWNGNRTYNEYKITIDTRAPTIEVLTHAHNMNQGGTGLVVYKVSEADTASGVQVGDAFFPGHGGPGHRGLISDAGCYMALFAIPHDIGPDMELHIKATDRAGNTGKAGFFHHINRKVFKQDTIGLSDDFLRQKMPEFDGILGTKNDTAGSLIDKFVAVNRDLRLSSNGILNEVTQKSEPRQYWEGAFLRLPRSAQSAGFADHRRYRYNDTDVDEQTHLGIDLASTSRSPVPAANNGRVVFADYLGIYGKTILLDHGFGLFSMYGHLSEIDVVKGNMVSRGDVIGRTGSTGLAGGDHLHYAMMVGDVFVNPVEWWDPNWIENNVVSKIRDVKEMMSQGATRQTG